MPHGAKRSDNVTYNAYHEKDSDMYGARGNNRLWLTKVNIPRGPVKGVFFGNKENHKGTRSLCWRVRMDKIVRGKVWT